MGRQKWSDLPRVTAAGTALRYFLCDAARPRRKLKKHYGIIRKPRVGLNIPPGSSAQHFLRDNVFQLTAMIADSLRVCQRFSGSICKQNQYIFLYRPLRRTLHRGLALLFGHHHARRVCVVYVLLIHNPPCAEAATWPGQRSVSVLLLFVSRSSIWFVNLA